MHSNNQQEQQTAYGQTQAGMTSNAQGQNTATEQQQQPQQFASQNVQHGHVVGDTQQSGGMDSGRMNPTMGGVGGGQTTGAAGGVGHDQSYPTGVGQQGNYDGSNTQGQGLGGGGGGREYQQTTQQDYPDSKNHGGHTGRNIGLGVAGAGAGAEAAHLHHQHEQNQHGQQQSGIGQTGQHDNFDGSDTQGHRFGRGGDGAQYQQTNQHDAQNHGGHIGRNVGLGVAGAGVGAEAAHHHHQHEQNKQGANVGGAAGHPPEYREGYESVAGQQGNYDGSDTRGHGFGRGGDGTQNQQSNQHDVSDTKNHGGHTGRNVGLGLAGAGVAGEAAHHHHQHEQNQHGQQQSGIGQTGQRDNYDGSNTQGHGFGRGGDGTQYQQSNQHDGSDAKNHGGHTGRNVGLGVAGAGVGAEAAHHHHQHEQNKQSANVGGPGGHPGEYQQGYESVIGQTNQHDVPDAQNHGGHTGRNVGLGLAGAGVAGEAAHHHHQHEQNKHGQQQSGIGQTGQHDNYDGSNTQGHGIGRGGDRAGYQQTNQQDNSDTKNHGGHTGRNVGLGLAGAGVGAEAAHHHHQHDQNKQGAGVGGAAGHPPEYREGYESVAGQTSTGPGAQAGYGAENQGGQATGYQQADRQNADGGRQAGGHHAGQAVGAGLVGAGAGAEIAHHHHAHDAKRDNTISGEAFNGPADQPFHQQNTAAGIDNSDGRAGGPGGQAAGYQQTAGTNDGKQSGGHHVGPAVGAGVVGAGVGAEMAHHHHAQGAQGMQGGNSVHGEGFGGPAHQPSAPNNSTTGTGVGGEYPQQQAGGVGMGNQGIGNGPSDITGTQGGGGIHPGAVAAAAATGAGVGMASGAGQGGMAGQSGGVTGGTQNAGGGGLAGKAQAFRQQTAGETKGPLRGVTAQTIGGKLQQLGGVLLGSTALKEKGIEREQRAAAQVDVHNAQRLEQEAMGRRERAVGLGAHPDHGKLGGKQL